MSRPERSSEEEDLGAADDGVARDTVGYNLKRAYMVLFSVAQAALADLGLRTTTFSCLSVIVRNPGIGPSMLAERLKMERSNIVVVLDELETAGMIRRAQSKSDRRRYALTATLAGRRAVEKAAKAIRHAEGRPLRSLTADEQVQLVELLNRIEFVSTD